MNEKPQIKMKPYKTYTYWMTKYKIVSDLRLNMGGQLYPRSIGKIANWVWTTKCKYEVPHIFLSLQFNSLWMFKILKFYQANWIFIVQAWQGQALAQAWLVLYSIP
jgi:hypothetical protein